MIEITRVTAPELWALVEARQALTAKERANIEGWVGRTTDMWVVIISGEVCGVFGIAPTTLLSDAVYMWLWWTDRLARHSFTFTRWSRIVISELLARYTRIYGVCEAAADRSQRWLRWLGAEFGPAKDGWAPFEIRAR